MNAELTVLSKRQHGLVHHRQLVDLNMSTGQIRSLCAHGGWVPIGQGVYRRTDLAQTLHQRLLAVTMQCGATAALSHASAAWLWGLAGHSAYGPIHVRSDRTATSRRPHGVALHRGASLPRLWVTEHLGIPVVRPEIVALQLLTAQFRGADTAASADVDTMWSLRLLTPDSIARCLADLGTRGRRGVGAVRRYLAERPDSNAHPISALEQRLTDLVAAAGRHVERPKTPDHELPCGNTELMSADGSVLIRVHHERYRPALDVRSRDENHAPSMTTGDAAAGFTVVGLTDAEVWKRPRHVTAKIATAFETLRLSA